MMERYEAATKRALAVDPNYIAAGSGLIVSRVERGDLIEAYRVGEDLVRRRPDNADAHFALSYVLRFAGLLDESARQCDTAFLLDPRAQASGLRSCAVVFLLRGDYPRAMNYVDLDHGSDWAKALSIHILVRNGKEAEALASAHRTSGSGTATTCCWRACSRARRPRFLRWRQRSNQG